MADKLKIWRTNRWFGGMSDDKHVGIDGSSWRLSGVETRRFPRMLQLAKKMTNQAGAVISTALRCGVVTSAFGDTIVAGTGGKVYRRARNASTWALVYTDSGSDEIQSMCEYNGYLYWATKDKLHRIVVTDTGTDTTWTTVTEDYQTFATTTLSGHPMIEAFNNLYLGDGDQVAMLSSASVWTANKVQLGFDDEVRRITFTGNMIRFWCRKAVNASTEYERDEGMVYLWNGTSDSYTEAVRLCGQFQTCATMDGVDYFIAGQNPVLCVLNGLTPVPLKSLFLLSNPSGDDNTLQRLRFWPNSMAACRGTIYFGSPVAINVNWMEVGVWSWGRKDAGYPLSLNLDYPLTGDAPSLVLATDGALTVGQTDGATEYCWYETWSAYQATGVAETRVFDGNNPWQVKDAVMLSISFYPLATGEKIEVYVATNMGSYGSAVLTAQYSDTADRNVTHKVLSLPFTGKEFNEVQLKVKLTAGDSQATTPKLIDLSLLYEDVKRP